MRLILIGCEYAGTTTLIGEIGKWVERAMGGRMGIHDHWKIPQVSHAPHTKEENEAFLALSPNLQESFQRYHMTYHLSPSFYGEAHHTMVGFHIDEAVYAPLYYGYGGPGEYSDRELHARRTDGEIMEIAPDTVLVLLKASPDAICERMKAARHEYALVKEKDIAPVLDMFAQQYERSFIRNKFELDNTEKTVEETLAEFVERVQPHLLERDRLRILTRILPR